MQQACRPKTKFGLTIDAMSKFHVVLDTNIYRKSPKRTDLAFLALERLAKAGLIQLHLPYVVEREFQTQQMTQYKKEIDAALGGLESLVKKGLEASQLASVQGLIATLSGAAPTILTDVEQALPNWIASLGGKRHPITETQARAAMEAYFLGSAPLKAQKIRDDIPDSFIFQVIADLAKSGPALVVVAEDEKIAQASESLENVSVHRSLSAFIESKPIQTELLDLDIVKNLPALHEVIEDYEKQNAKIDILLRHEAGKSLVWKTVYSRSIPDDNHEATITGYYDPEDIELDFENLSYYGYGEFGLPFTFSSIVSVTYYIFKSDFYALDEKKMPSISDHNDHYFEAEDEIKINVSGIIKLSFDPEALKSLTADNVDEHMTIGIDSIDEISVQEND